MTRERNADSRIVAEGGHGPSARPMLAADRGGFVDQHDCWSEAQYAAAVQVRRVVDEVGLERVRICFADQHGILRSKTVTRDALPGVLRDGITAPSSLLLKDTSGKSVFPVFTATPVEGHPEFAGAGDVVLVPDPTTFRVLPWAERTGWLLCDLRSPGGAAVPFDPRGILRRQLGRVAALGYELVVGAELEFHVFATPDGPLDPAGVGGPDAPGAAPEVAPTTAGAQLLHEEALDRLDPLVDALYHALTRLDLPLRSIELEFGHSQLEVTLAPLPGLAAADAVALTRTAIRQVAHRHGYLASFMARPAGPSSGNVGWHVHQSLRAIDGGGRAFVPEAGDEPLSKLGRHYLAGLLKHAAAATPFAVPTINGYKRFSAYALAPDRVNWGVDNKGAMLRIAGAGGDATRIENRAGEPAANPYLYLAAQLVSGLAGIEDALDPGAATDRPYEDNAAPLPKTLADALAALDDSSTFRTALGDEVVDWFLGIKRAEWDRYLSHVSDWEQLEYLGLF